MKRLLYYILLALLCIIMPFILTAIIILITGDRVSGMGSGGFIGIIAVHLIFGLIFIKNRWLIKLIWLTVLNIIIYYLLAFLSSFNIIYTHLDLYGYWDMVITNFISGVIVWETYYHINQKLK